MTGAISSGLQVQHDFLLGHPLSLSLIDRTLIGRDDDGERDGSDAPAVQQPISRRDQLAANLL